MLPAALLLSKALPGAWAGRSLQAHLDRPTKSRTVLAVVDCGDAFQPCCRVGQSCSGNNLVCVALASNATMCEPCGTAFSQPCPVQQYCASGTLIPTQSALRLSLFLHVLNRPADCTQSCATPRRMAAARAHTHPGTLLNAAARAQGERTQGCNAGHAVRNGSPAAPLWAPCVATACCATQSKTDVSLQSTSALGRTFCP